MTGKASFWVPRYFVIEDPELKSGGFGLVGYVLKKKILKFEKKKSIFCHFICQNIS